MIADTRKAHANFFGSPSIETFSTSTSHILFFISASSLSNFVVEVGNFGYCGEYPGTIGSERVVIPCEKPVKGDTVSIVAPFEDSNSVSLCEVEVHTQG